MHNIVFSNAVLFILFVGHWVGFVCVCMAAGQNKDPCVSLVKFEIFGFLYNAYAGAAVLLLYRKVECWVIRMVLCAEVCGLVHTIISWVVFHEVWMLGPWYRASLICATVVSPPVKMLFFGGYLLWKHQYTASQNTMLETTRLTSINHVKDVIVEF